MSTQLWNGSIWSPQLVGFDDAWGDAFGRLRVSQTATLFESSFTYDTQPLLFEPVSVSGGTVAHEASALKLSVDGTLGSLAAVQSRQYLPYEKGKSQLIKMTGVLGNPVTGVRRRFGYFDLEDGFFVEQSEVLRLGRRSSTTGTTVETFVPQSEWNLDPLDGTGPSGITLDPSRAQILVIDGQWLGVGRVRVGFNIDGITYYVHEWLHANRHDVAPYTRSFTLPVRYEIETVTVGGIGDLIAVCCDVESEGGVDSPTGFTFAAANESDVATSTTPVPLLSLRPALDFPQGGRTNRSFVIPGEVSLLVSSADCLIEVQYDADLTGGAWSRANPNSAVEVGVGQALAAPGIQTQSLFATAGQRNNTASAAGDAVTAQYPLTLDIGGANPKAITVVATAVSATGTARASIGWREIR